MVFSGSFWRFEMSQLHKLFFRFPVVSFSFSLDAFFFSKADVLNSGLVLVARTDAEAATMIDSNIDAWWSRKFFGCFFSPPQLHIGSWGWNPSYGKWLGNPLFIFIFDLGEFEVTKL